MSNYIMINNQRIELSEEQVAQIIAAQKKEEPQIKLADVAVGDTFRIGAYEFIVLEHSGDTTAVVLKDLLPEESRFGDSNNYKDSIVAAVCNAFADELEQAVGQENLIPHRVDLTANDGLKDYGEIQCRASLMTANRYRRYVEVLDRFKPEDWWWLATPFSTKTHDNDLWILCVSPSGCILYYHCYYVHGVRPFCILKSTIFVSK